MRKLSAIIALALCVTIGGVFAAWHYNRGEVSLEISRSATMASIQSDTSKGTISIDQTANSGNGNTLKFLVDDIDTIDWKAALVPSGSVWVKFTPAANADTTVRENGIKMKATVTISGDQTKYDGKSVFTLKAQNTFTLNSTPTKDSVEITATQIADCLTFNEGTDVVLDSYDKNLAFETAMKSYIIVITISEAV